MSLQSLIFGSLISWSVVLIYHQNPDFKSRNPYQKQEAWLFLLNKALALSQPIYLDWFISISYSHIANIGNDHESFTVPKITTFEIAVAEGPQAEFPQHTVYRQWFITWTSIRANHSPKQTTTISRSQGLQPISIRRHIIISPICLHCVSSAKTIKKIRKSSKLTPRSNCTAKKDSCLTTQKT